MLPNLASPTTFNEKILYRRLFDRRPILRQLAGKFSMRAYVDSRLGPGMMPELYHLTTSPETIPYDQFPDKFVVKPTHCSGWVRVVMDKSELEVAPLTQKLGNLLRHNFGAYEHQWAYDGIAPEIIVEEFIDDGSGDVPLDYKLFVFDGSVQVIQVDKDRFTNHRRRLFTPTWENLNVEFGFKDIIGKVPRPPHLDEMIEVAEKLGEGLDFIRVDMYDTDKRSYFGEFTLYPDGGFYRFRPHIYDRILGRHWKLLV